MPAAKSKFDKNELTKPLIMGEDGSLKRQKAERFALNLADGLTATEAWYVAYDKHPQANSSRQLELRRHFEQDPVFKLRVEHLMAEKEAVMSDGVFGNAMWMATQLWRRGVCEGDSQMMQKAADLTFRLSEKMAPPPEGGAPAGRGPGKPSAENPQSRRNPAQIKQALMDLGNKPSLADAEPEGEA